MTGKHRFKSAVAMLKVMVSSSFTLQGAVYGALAPQLVSLQASVGFSDAFAGLLTGSYTAGMLPGVFGILLFGSRVHAKPIFLIGLVCIGISSAFFGIAQDPDTLLIARAGQGLGAGICFAGGTAWLSGAVPVSERGAALGLAWGGMTIGAVLGPVLGVLASAVGAWLLYGCVGLIFLVLSVIGLRIRRQAHPTNQTASATKIPNHWGKLWIPLALLVSPALVIGVLNVLAPLAIGKGEGTPLVTVAYLCAAVAGGIASPLAGRLSDCFGAAGVISMGLCLSAVTALGFAMTSSPMSQMPFVCRRTPIRPSSRLEPY